MSISRTKLFCCAVVLASLWGCVTPAEETTAEPSTKNDMPIGNFFRTAAATSQEKFDYESAAKYYQNLYNRDANDMEALLGLVRNLRYIGSAARSLAILEEAMPIHPDVFALRAEYAKSLVASGQAEDAVNTLSGLLEEVPDDWELLSALGIAYDLTDNSGQAEQAYRAALEVAPRNKIIINNLALSLALSGKIDDGIAMLEEATADGFSTPHIRQNLALMYAMKGNILAARRLAEQDLPEELVENNIKYYERLYAQAGGGRTVGVVEVSRLEEPVEAVVEPVISAPAAEPRDETAVAALEEAADMARMDQTSSLPIEGIKVQLGVFKTLDRATAGLSEMRDKNVDLLSGLRFVIDEIEGIDAPVGYMVLAGPLASQQVAADLCTKLHSRKKVCRLIRP